MNRNARRNIKKAEKNGITIEFNQGYHEFYDMYNDHRKSKKHIKWFDVHTLNDIKKYGTLVVAKYNDEIISGSVFLEDEDNLVYWITASYRYSQNKETRQLSGNATYLIQKEIINYAKLKGIKEYNLGPCGYENNVNKPLKQFKENLGGKPHKYYGYDKNYSRLYARARSQYGAQVP